MRCFRMLLLILLACSLSAGCERKEKVLDIETPAGEIEIERTPATDAIDIDVDVDVDE